MKLSSNMRDYFKTIKEVLIKNGGQMLFFVLIFVAILSVFFILPTPKQFEERQEVVNVEEEPTPKWSEVPIIHEGIKEEREKQEKRLFSSRLNIINETVTTPKEELEFIDVLEEEELEEDNVKEIVPEKPKGEIRIIQAESYHTEKGEVELIEKYDFQTPKTPKGKKKIAIVIDDLGMSFSRLKTLLEIDQTFNLAFLPDAPNLTEQASYALDKGHHLLLHMPMQPKSRNIDTGPIVLKPEMSNTELLKMLKQGLNSFEGFKGVNNHMGSAFTEYEAGMKLVLSYLKSQDLYFLDSKTTANSVGRTVAQDVGIIFAERDIFLDHVNELDVINQRLADTEKKATSKGYAIAIGHPYPATIEALSAWAKTLEAKGYELVSLEELLEHPVTLKN